MMVAMDGTRTDSVASRASSERGGFCRDREGNLLRLLDCFAI